MTEYALYVESGPRRRTTMVHVFDLLGCIANGPTTEAALEATPDAIRAFLRLASKHGEAVDPDAPFTMSIAAHVMEGSWIGQGDPDAGFAPDFEPLSEADLQTYRRRLRWLREELIEKLEALTPAQLNARPKSGRTIARIIGHVAGADYAFLRTPISKPTGLSQAYRLVTEGPELLPEALDRFWQLCDQRLAAVTDAERHDRVQHGMKSVTARRSLRRMLEHAWEHLAEIDRRLALPD